MCDAKCSLSYHVDLGYGPHAAHHNVDLDGGWRPAKVRSHAVVVAPQQVVQQLAYVAVVVDLRALTVLLAPARRLWLRRRSVNGSRVHGYMSVYGFFFLTSYIKWKIRELLDYFAL